MTTQSYLHKIVLVQPGSPDLGTLSCPPETGSGFWTEAKSDLCVEGRGSSLGKAESPQRPCMSVNFFFSLYRPLLSNNVQCALGKMCGVSLVHCLARSRCSAM